MNVKVRMTLAISSAVVSIGATVLALGAPLKW